MTHDPSTPRGGDPDRATTTSNVVPITTDPDAVFLAKIRLLRAKSAARLDAIRASQALREDRQAARRAAHENVVPITTDPLAQARAILAVGREEFRAALQRLQIATEADEARQRAGHPRATIETRLTACEAAIARIEARSGGAA